MRLLTAGSLVRVQLEEPGTPYPNRYKKVRILAFLDTDDLESENNASNHQLPTDDLLSVRNSDFISDV